MKKRISVAGYAVRMAAVLLLCMLAVAALVMSPELKYDDLSFGAPLAMLLTGAATLVWNSIEND